MTPSVDMLNSNIPECVGEFLLQESRPVEEHIQLFASLPMEEEVLGGKVAKRVKLISQQSTAGAQFGRTSAKEKLRATKLWAEDGEEGQDSDDVSESLGVVSRLQAIAGRMQGIQEETFDVSPFKDSMPASLAELVQVVQVQGTAIREIESRTNHIASRIEGSVVSLKADIGVRPASVDELPGLQIWDIVAGLSRQLDDMALDLGVMESRYFAEVVAPVKSEAMVAKLSVDVIKATRLIGAQGVTVTELTSSVQGLGATVGLAQLEVGVAKDLALLVKEEIVVAGASVVGDILN